MSLIELSSGESCGGDGADDNEEYEPQSDPTSMDEMVKKPLDRHQTKSDKKSGKKEKSAVWQHFEVVGGATKCRYCQQPFKSKQTSNLARHLRKCKKLRLLTGEDSGSGDEFEKIEEIELGNEVEVEVISRKRDNSDVHGLPKVFVPEPKKRKPSAVWSHFTKRDNAYECNYCKRGISVKNGNGSNLSRHLRKKHDFTDIEAAPSGLSVESSVELDEPILREDSPVSTDRDYIRHQSGPRDTRGTSSRHDSRETYSQRHLGLASRSGTYSKRPYHPDDRRTLDFRDDYDQPARLKHPRGEPIPELSDFLQFRSPRRRELSVPPRRTPSKASVCSSVAKKSPDAASNAHYLLSLLPFMNSLSPQSNMEIRIEIQNAFSRRLFADKKPPKDQVAKTDSAEKPRKTSEASETPQNDIVISETVQDRAESGNTVQHEIFVESQTPNTNETVQSEVVTQNIGQNQCIQNEVVCSNNGQNEILEQYPTQKTHVVQDAFQYV